MASFEALFFSVNEECLLEAQKFNLPTADLSIYDLREKISSIFGDQSLKIFWKDHMNSRRSVDCDQEMQILLAEHQNQLVSTLQKHSRML